MFPRTELRPFQWQDYTDEPIFDPKIHLSNWNIDEIKQESSKLPNDSTKFGFTKPFKFLTDEGYSVIRTILNREYQNGFVKPDRRIQYCLRGVTYRSPFLRAFSESCELSKLASEVVEEPLIIHPILSNHSHVNWGLPTDQTGEVKNVDQWHQDSVSHVLIVLMSDMTDSVGGELEIIFKPTAEAFKMLADTNNNIPNEQKETTPPSYN